jgi:DNA-binding beta-propeller fold protein YncE
VGARRPALGASAWLVRLAAVAAALSGFAGAAAADFPLHTLARVPLPGPSNRFDYMSVDATSGELYIAHMDAGQLLVFDLRHRRVAGTVPVPGVHGVITVPQLGRVFASATDAHQALTIDAKSHRILARAPAGEYPDGLAYDPVERHVFVSDESGGVEAVLDARGRRVATVELDGEAGNVQYDSGSRTVLVAVQSRDELAVVDPRANRVSRRVALPGCDHDHGLLVDAARRLAFVACDGNATLLTVDLRTMRVTGQATVGRSPDVLAFDRVSRRLYVAAESGDVAVFAERGRSLAKLGQAKVADEAHSVAIDPHTHLVYFPLESGPSGRPSLLIMRPS